MFLRNTWYPCAWSNDVGRDLRQRWICGEPVVFYRTEAGRPVALQDRCAHRRAPLSKGRLVGDRVQCGYHGLEFDCTGRCVKIPGQDAIPEDAAVRSYSVVDRWRFLWIWMGDPAQADDTSIPDLYWNDDPEWVAPGDTLTIDANYLLVLDNLMDLSHLTFLHGRTIGTPYVTEFPSTARTAGDRVSVTRWMLDRPAPPMFQKVGGFTDNVDRWQIIDWSAPGNVVIDVGCAVAGTGAPQGDRSRGIEGRSLNLVTPMTERSSLYLWSYCRHYKQDDESVTRTIYEDVKRTFLEDKDMIEAQQHLIDTDSPDRSTVDIRVDAGPLQVRRVLERLVRRETQGVAVAA
jgi:phenylpropionate dioxygenase-like ring-hydroxylating dioxygenase large terminal subunit